MRGKAHPLLAALVSVGITPACAGKSTFVPEMPDVTGDHPRMCGEKHNPLGNQRPGRGSPPHVRGKVSLMVEVSARQGITPACAGKRMLCLCRCRRYEDHPRMCGEKMVGFFVFIWKTGSPPHVRGKDGRAVALAHGNRITPACAGKSSNYNGCGALVRDHPRMCGEKRSGKTPSSS